MRENLEVAPGFEDAGYSDKVLERPGLDVLSTGSAIF
jgi:hypothetical protein